MMTWPSADRAVTHRHDYETILSPEGLETVYWTQTCLVCGTPASDLLMARSSAPRVGSCCGEEAANCCASDADTTSPAPTSTDKWQRAAMAWLGYTDYATPWNGDVLVLGYLGMSDPDACPACGDVDDPCCCDTDARACDAGSCYCD